MVGCTSSSLPPGNTSSVQKLSPRVTGILRVSSQITATNSRNRKDAFLFEQGRQAAASLTDVRAIAQQFERKTFCEVGCSLKKVKKVSRNGFLLLKAPHHVKSLENLLTIASEFYTEFPNVPGRGSAEKDAFLIKESGKYLKTVSDLLDIANLVADENRKNAFLVKQGARFSTVKKKKKKSWSPPTH